MFSFLFGRSSARRVPKRAAAKPVLNLESLEDRAVPATFVVSNIGDQGDGTLRDAVAKANAASGADVIQLQVTTNDGVITLTEGEINVTDDLSIVGQGGDTTYIGTGRTSRIFNVESDHRITLRLEKLSLYQAAAQGEGGAVRVSGARLEAIDAGFLQNKADKGGAVAVLDHQGHVGEAVFDQTVFSQNVAGTSGGAIYLESSQAPTGTAHVELTASAFVFNAVNSPNGGGAGIAVESGVLNVVANSLTGNTSMGGGGGIDGGVNSTINVLGSTIHQNASTSGLGGAGILARGALTISNSTITSNSDTSNSSVGGVRHLGPGGMLLSSTIVAENTGLTAGSSPDLQSNVSVISDGHNLIGKSAGVNGLLGTDLINVDPMLGPAQFNGGNTHTRVPLTGSPTIGAGNNPYGAAFDQRGEGFARVTQGKVDIGAVQYDASNATPNVTLYAAPPVGLGSSATVYDFAVSYTDDTAINFESLDNTDVVVTGPNGFRQSATLVQTNVSANAPTVLGQYRIFPPGGTWKPLHNGTYTIELNAKQVFDAKGRPVQGQILGTFNVEYSGDDIGYVEGLYRSVLGRSADAVGLQAYTDRLNGGESRESIAREIWDSMEHRALQVFNIYRSILNRNPDQTGLEYWTQRLLDGASEEEVTKGILASKEFQDAKGQGAALTNNFYHSLFGRPADAAATVYVKELEAGATTPAQVADELISSQERVELDIDALYRGILLRNADDEGKTEWTKKARDGVGVGEVAIAMLASDEFFKLHGSEV